MRIIYLEVRMSPLLVAWASYDVNGADLGHSHFYRRMASNENVGGVNWHNFFLKRKHSSLTVQLSVF